MLNDALNEVVRPTVLASDWWFIYCQVGVCIELYCRSQEVWSCIAFVSSAGVKILQIQTLTCANECTMTEERLYFQFCVYLTLESVCIFLYVFVIWLSSQYVYLHVLKLKRPRCVLLFVDVQVIRWACFIPVTCWLNSLSPQVFVAAYVNEIGNACYWLAQTSTWLFAYLECSCHETATRKKENIWEIAQEGIVPEAWSLKQCMMMASGCLLLLFEPVWNPELVLGLEDEAGSLLFVFVFFVGQAKLWILDVGWLLHASKEDECFVSCKRIAVMLAFSRRLHK